MKTIKNSFEDHARVRISYGHRPRQRLRLRMSFRPPGGSARGGFLSWVGRELGREIVYSSPQTAADVASIVVRGSISRLIPAQALEAVLATISVRAVMANGRIVAGSEDPAYQPAD